MSRMAMRAVVSVSDRTTEGAKAKLECGHELYFAERRESLKPGRRLRCVWCEMAREQRQ